MPRRSAVLANRYLVAHFSPTTGALVRLAAAGTRTNFVDSISCRYLERLSDTWTGESEDDKDTMQFTAVCVELAGSHVQSTLRSPHVTVTRRFALDSASPLLQVGLTIQTMGVAGELAMAGFPAVRFAPGFADVFEDERDLYFDGAELGDATQLPCWRVFLRKRGADGLLLVTRSKQQMSHAEILADGFRVCPHHGLNYSTQMPRPTLDVSVKRRYDVAFELGPWQRRKHTALLRASSVRTPVATDDPPPLGRPARIRKGKILRAVNFVPATASTSQFSTRKWMIAKMPWAQGGKALFAGPGVHPPALRVDPKLKGTYRIFVGVGNGAGVKMKLGSDPHFTFRISGGYFFHGDDRIRAPFGLYLSGRQRCAEIHYGTATMDGQNILLERFPDLHTATVIDYVRFEKLSPAQEHAWHRTQQRRPCVALSGFNDIPDIATLTDAQHPDPQAYVANIWEHARNKFSRIYWRIDGQCSDYPSKINTMRYLSAKVHGVFNPQFKAYGRTLRKVDMLRLAVDAAKKYGVELYGWMRFNSYFGNVQSDFFKDNPGLWEQWETGYRGGKLCLALPQVRRHKINILVEAAGYGLDGVNLGFLRHPPVLMYHPRLVAGYKRRYGRLPPRNRQNKDTRYFDSLPPNDDEHLRWYAYRAAFMTKFGRELRAALSAAGLGHVKISIWVRPKHCLFDGIDLPAWLDEALCDEVVVDAPAGIHHDNIRLYGVPKRFKRMVQAKVPLIRGIPYGRIQWCKQHVPDIVADGYDGLCTYESDFAVLDTDYLKLYQRLRK